MLYQNIIKRKEIGTKKKRGTRSTPFQKHENMYLGKPN